MRIAAIYPVRSRPASLQFDELLGLSTRTFSTVATNPGLADDVNGLDTLGS